MVGKVASIRDALAACFAANDQPLTKAQVFAWINHVYKNNTFNPNTLYHQLRRSCINRPSAQKYKTPKIIFFDESTGTFLRAALSDPNLPLPSVALDTKDSLDEDDTDEIGDSTFALEGYLRDFLAKNLTSLGKDLRLWCVSPPSVEFAIAGRRIDILAKDKDGTPVIIELKLNKGYDRVIGQALLYKGLVLRELQQTKVRIILVASSVSEELRIACSTLDDVMLFEYSLAMQVEQVNSSRAEENE